MFEKMCEPNMNMIALPPPPPNPSSPSTPSPQFPLYPNSPEISTRYHPKVLKRMQTDTCFKCQQKGHWSWDCPMNSPNAKSLSHSPNNGSPSPQKIWCRCGHGLCQVRTVRNGRNKGREYYVCPINRGKPCRDWIKWCDDVTVSESDMHPPPYKYPMCVCGAGVCRKEKDPDGYYFACPIGEGHGSCGYRVWEDELLQRQQQQQLSLFPQDDELLDNKNDNPTREGIQTSPGDFLGDNKNDKLVEGGDRLVEHSKRMRIMKNSERSSSMAVFDFEPLEREDATPKAVGFPKSEVADDLEEVINSLPWDAFEEETFRSSQRSTSSRIRCRRNLFQRDILSGPLLMGWLGRLLFLHPTESLKFTPPQPYICCIFPSFNPIIVPKQVSTHHDGPCESNQLAITSLSHDNTQLSNGIHHSGVSIVANSPNKSPGSGRKPMSKTERQRKVALSAQQHLLTELETLDPHDHESMRQAAEDTFTLLDSLSVDYKHFSVHVWDFINCASSIAEIDISMKDFLSDEEHHKLYEEEKLKRANIQDNYVKTEALFDACTKRSQSLEEEVSHLEAMLLEKKNQLNSCELEALKIKSHLGELKRSMLDADISLKFRAEQAELARKLNEERQIKHSAAKTALEMAKFELEN